jgi:WD40 repeat protein
MKRLTYTLFLIIVISLGVACGTDEQITSDIEQSSISTKVAESESAGSEDELDQPIAAVSSLEVSDAAPPPTTVVPPPTLTVAPTPTEQRAQIITTSNLRSITEIARLGHGQLYDVNWSADGYQLAVASSLGVYVYDVETLAAQLTIETEKAVLDTAFLPVDGALVLSFPVEIRDAHDGTLQTTLDPLGSRTIAISPDGNMIASAGLNVINLWNAGNDTLIQTIDVPGGGGQIAFSPDGELIATSYNYSHIQLWHVSDGLLVRTLTGENGRFIQSIAISPDGQLLAANVGLTIRIWRISDGTVLHTLETGDTKSLDFSPDSTLLASGSGTEAQIWRVADGTLLHRLTSHKNEVMGVSFSPDGQLLASVSNWGGDVRIWQVSDGTLLRTSQGHTGLVTEVVFSPDGQVLASAAGDGRIRLWDVSERETVQILDAHADSVSDLAFAPDGSMLASSGGDNMVNLWHTNDWSLLQAFEGGAATNTSVYSVAFSPDSQTLISGTFGEIHLWQTDGTGLRQTIQGPGVHLAYAPDGTSFAVATVDGVQLHQASDGSLIRTFGAGHIVTSLAFSPDGTLLAEATESINVWRVSDGVLLYALNGHRETIESLAFSPDGTLLVSGADDFEAHIWRVEDGQLRQTLQGHKNPIKSVAFSPDGTMIVTAALDGTIRFWGVP